MIIGRAVMHSGNRRWFPIRYLWMKDDELITAVVVAITQTDETAADFAVPTFVHTQSVVSGNLLEVLAGKGIDGTVYLMEVSITTSLGQEQTDCIEITVDNRGC